MVALVKYSADCILGQSITWKIYSGDPKDIPAQYQQRLQVSNPPAIYDIISLDQVKAREWNLFILNTAVAIFGL